MPRTLIMTLCFLLAACAGSTGLTEAERSKLDPGLLKLVLGERPVSKDDVTSLRPDGAREFAVIIRSTNADELKKMGIPIGSVFSEIVTARVTLAELRKVVSLNSVQAVQAGATDQLH